MKNLDEINRIVGSSKKVFSISLVIPVFVGILGWALATEAAPRRSIWGNYIGISGLALAMIAVLALAISHFIKWNWEAKYFGAFLYPFSTGSLLAIYPLLCIVQYGKFSIVLRLSIAAASVAVNGWWCTRVVKLYSGLDESEYIDNIYLQESTEVYYLKREDERFIGRRGAKYLMPDGKLFGVAILFGFVCLPFHMFVAKYTGLPSTHLLLAIISFPIGMLILGLSTKFLFVFYLYPNKIQQKTGKKVYIDIS